MKWLGRGGEGDRGLQENCEIAQIESTAVCVIFWKMYSIFIFTVVLFVVAVSTFVSAGYWLLDEQTSQVRKTYSTLKRSWISIKIIMNSIVANFAEYS